MKSVLAIIAIVAAGLMLIFFYLGQALEAPKDEMENLPPLTGFRGPAVSAPTSTTSSAATFFPPVFVGPFASPKIIGPKSDPPAPVATTTGS